MIKYIDHIAVKASNINKICRSFETLGTSCTSIEKYDKVGLKIAFLNAGETSIELLEVIDKNSPIAHDKNGLHHLALKTDNIKAAYKEMTGNDKFQVEGEIRKGTHDCKIFFFKIKGMENVLFECVG